MSIRKNGSRTEEIMSLVATSSGTLTKSTAEEVEESLKLIEDLKFFLATAPVNWQENQVIRRYYLNNDQGFVSCIFWNNLYYITGTDVVKCCIYRMQRFGRDIIQKKKFEEGIFSDLRNLKCGIDATLEQPKSEFLSFLFRNMCLKTQKKQKVFFWFSLPHDKIFADALERDLKREQLDQLATTKAINQPALSFSYDSDNDKTLYDQVSHHVKTTRLQNDLSRTHSTLSTGIMSPLQIPSDILEPTPATGLHGTGVQILDKNLIEDTMSSRCSSRTSSDDKLANVKVKTELIDHGELPLDYFPVEVEYPHQENELETLISQPLEMLGSVNMMMESSISDENMVPMTATIKNFPYPFAQPVGWPMAVTPSQMLVNNEYYTPNPQGKIKSPRHTSRDSMTRKYINFENMTDQAEETKNPTADEHGEMKELYMEQQPHPQMFLNPYQQMYPNNIPPGYYPSYAYRGYPQELPTSRRESSGYDEMLQYSNENFGEAYYMPPESVNWNGFPPQFMQNPYGQHYRQSSISGGPSYISGPNGAWFPAESAYPTKPNSRPQQKQQQNTSNTRSRHFPKTSISKTANKFYFAKTGKISKPVQNPSNFQQRTSKIKLQTKFRRAKENIDMRNVESSQAKNQFSMLTPQPTILSSQPDEISGKIRQIETNDAFLPDFIEKNGSVDL